MRAGRLRPAAGLLAPAVLLVAVLAGCSAGQHRPQDRPQDLGRVPIPSAPASGRGDAVLTASPGHAQLVAMGDTVRVGAGTVTALGPQFAAGSGMDRRAGRVTVQSAGRLAVCARDLTVHDESGAAVAMRVVGTECGRRITLYGTLTAGHATLVWSRSGRPLVTWDFEVELD